EQSVFAFERKAKEGASIIVVSNFTPIPRDNYRFGVHEDAEYKEILNSDSAYYMGSNLGNFGTIQCEEIESHGKPYSISLTIPPLATIFIVKEAKPQAVKKAKKSAKVVKKAEEPKVEKVKAVKATKAK
ncbi:alpha amylase, C-terminal all-beta domain protein, partial [Glaesserella parasuis MN-H]